MSAMKLHLKRQLGKVTYATMQSSPGAALFLVWCTALRLLTAEASVLPQPASHSIDFRRDVKPILETSCLQCHGHGRDKSGFQVDTRETLLKGGDSGKAVVEGKSAESLLIQLVSGVDPDNVMPRKGKRLSPEQIGILRAWIDQGLPWEPGLTFAKAPALNLARRSPEVKFASATENPIDQLLRPYFDKIGFKRPGVVDDRVFARRVYLDVVGLLPPPADLQTFAQDTSPDKRVALIRRLLDDEAAYAQHWLSFWNDMLRNDYRGTGYIDGGRKQITSWLYESLRTNLPYDHFVAQLVNPTPESEGFVRGITWRGVVNASQRPEMQAAQSIAQVFMGVNLKCASCHDSFINDWRLSDAYGLASIYSEHPLEQFQCDKPTGKVAQPRFLYAELGEIDPDAPRPDRLRRLAEIITSPNDGRLTRTIVNRYWARFFGKGLVEPIDDMERPAWNQDLLDWLAEDLVTNRFDVKKTMERILTSEAYQLPAVAAGEGREIAAFRGPLVRRMEAEQFRDAVAQVAGVWYDKPDFPVTTNHVRAALVAADPLTAALGRPNREQVVTVRSTTTTTLQGLELTNGDTLARILNRGAKPLLADSPAPLEIVDRIYLTALGRNPKPTEQELALQVLGQPVRPEGVEDFLWAVCMLPEFQLVY
jgi:mono/diheme cytochrome c family protein